MRCEEVAERLPQVMDRPGRADPLVVSHVESCLRCQAEVAQYRRLLRVLHQLRSQGPEPPPGVVGDILAVLEEAANRGAVRSALTGRRVAYAGAAAAAGAATAGIVVVAARLRGRSRKVGLAS
jgi:hypothetical protein